ncbi:hypothetical protein QQ045_004493 [Rhodiola kirilowii]
MRGAVLVALDVAVGNMLQGWDNSTIAASKYAGYGTPSTCASPWELDFDAATTSKVISRFEIVGS